MRSENLVTRARKELHRLIIEDLRGKILTIETISIKHGVTQRCVCKIAKDNHLRRRDAMDNTAQTQILEK